MFTFSAPYLWVQHYSIYFTINNPWIMYNDKRVSKQSQGNAWNTHKGEREENMWATIWLSRRTWGWIQFYHLPQATSSHGISEGKKSSVRTELLSRTKIRALHFEVEYNYWGHWYYHRATLLSPSTNMRKVLSVWWIHSFQYEKHFCKLTYIFHT